MEKSKDTLIYSLYGIIYATFCLRRTPHRPIRPARSLGQPVGSTAALSTLKRGQGLLHGGQVVVGIKDILRPPRGRPCERTGVAGRQLGALEAEGRSSTAAGSPQTDRSERHSRAVRAFEEGGGFRN